MDMPLDPVRELRATAEHLRRVARVTHGDPGQAARLLERAAQLDEDAAEMEKRRRSSGRT